METATRMHFMNPHNHVPYLEEMSHRYARQHGSVLDKVASLESDALMELMIGSRAYDQIKGSPLFLSILDLVVLMKSKHQQLIASKIADRCFKKFNQGIIGENYELEEGSLSSFMNGVMNFVVPKDFLSASELVYIRFIAERLMAWKVGMPLIESGGSYPNIRYAVVEKEVRRSLEAWWKICGSKHLADALLECIASNLTYFFALYILHVLRTQTKVGLLDGVAKFYYINTYKEIMRNMSAVDSDMKGSCASSAFSSDSSADVTSMESTSMPTCTKVAMPQVKTEDQSFSKVSSTVLQQNGEKHDVGETSIAYTMLKFPRARPPDDIPVYDYGKVKRERLDITSERTETGSHTSSFMDVSHACCAGDWDEVLRTFDADEALPEQYKMAFRFLVMSNRDLREHNRVLRSQLEKK